MISIGIIHLLSNPSPVYNPDQLSLPARETRPGAARTLKRITVTDKPIQTERLENGLTLEIVDRSRQVAGDRWYLEIVARMEIPLDGPLGEQLGDRVVFEQRRVRNFVDSAQKDAAVDEMVDSFLTTVRPYLGHPDFPRRYAERCLRDRNAGGWGP